MKMHSKNTLDVHDENITPAIYSLLFSGILVELEGNDRWYEIDMENVSNTFFNDALAKNKQWAVDQDKQLKEMWDKRIARGYNNCYRNNKRMKEFIENPCTYQEAIKEFETYLIENGVGDDESILVSIWW